MPPRKPVMTLGDLGAALGQGLTKSAKNPNIHGYKPHAKQIAFHKSEAKVRLYIGGNRSGKTVGGVTEDIYWVKGEHPFKKVFEPPVHGRIIGVDFDNGIEKILKPQFQRWLPPSMLINGSWLDSYYATTKTLTLSNGSTLEFMSYVQDLEKFAGTSRHFIHFDEEPPKSIFNENKARLVDTGGSLWITETPVEGMTWVYDDIYLPGILKLDKNIDIIQVDMTENPHIQPEEVQEFLSGLSENERKARGRGEFVSLGGLVFKHFGETQIIEPVLPKHFSDNRMVIWASMDHGYNNPTAWLWHMVFADGSVITFDEHYVDNWTVSQHAERVKIIEMEHEVPAKYFIGDPAITQRNGVTGHSIQHAYMSCGIPIALAKNEVKAGLDRMNDYMLPVGGRPTWRVTSNCVNLIRELKRYRWKTWASAKLRDANNPLEEPHKKNDHACDSARYFFSFMPDLKLPEEVRNMRLDHSQILGAGTPVYADAIRTDPVWDRPAQVTEWSAVDEGVGIF